MCVIIVNLTSSISLPQDKSTWPNQAGGDILHRLPQAPNSGEAHKRPCERSRLFDYPAAQTEELVDYRRPERQDADITYISHTASRFCKGTEAY